MESPESPADEYLIDFDTSIQPGRIQAVRVRLDLVTIESPGSARVDLCDHPLYKELQRYVQENPRGEPDPDCEICGGTGIIGPEHVQDQMIQHCAQIAHMFQPGAKVTILVRNPSSYEGQPYSADVLFSDDEPGPIVESLQYLHTLLKDEGDLGEEPPLYER